MTVGPFDWLIGLRVTVKLPYCSLCDSYGGHALSCVKITKDYIEHEATPPRQIDGTSS